MILKMHGENLKLIDRQAKVCNIYENTKLKLLKCISRPIKVNDFKNARWKHEIKSLNFKVAIT